MNRPARALAALAAAAAVVPVAACGLQPSSGYAPAVAPGAIQPVDGAAGGDVTVGSKSFTEQLILGKIAVLALRAAGFDVTDATNIPGSNPAREALVHGDTTVGWEYTGTAWVSYLGETGIPDKDAQWQAVHDADLANGITWLPPAPLNNTYGLAMGPAAADELGITSMSQIADVPVADRTFCVHSEFRSRDDGFEPMLAHYGVPLGEPDGVPTENVRIMDTGAIYQATADGECSFGVIFTTDGRIQALDLTVLADDAQYFPSYNVAPNVATTVLEEHPEIADVFARITPLLTDQVMIGLNARVDVDGEEPADVALDWLVSQGLVSPGT
ncbi:glycine betaine ABC transporter substrate-binding protein [Isoptericola hypogeus]|uniref:Glycine betaine ABC transporter substrate-binding protein n=1 Tax=Isoptericola hypogeus TaxID=300179 RepID=A0ABN2JCW8_9MICO